MQQHISLASTAARREEAITLLLTRGELEALTSTKQPKRMAHWLATRGWVFEPAARRGDVPKVDRAYYFARMCGQRYAAAPDRPRVRLDFMTRASSSS